MDQEEFEESIKRLVKWFFKSFLKWYFLIGLGSFLFVMAVLLLAQFTEDWTIGAIVIIVALVLLTIIRATRKS